jgi:hypothetical protein
MADNRMLRSLVTGGGVCCYDQVDHLVQVEERVTSSHTSMDCLVRVIDIMGVVLKLHAESRLSEHAFHHEQGQKRQHEHVLVGGSAITLQGELLRHDIMDFEDIIDHDQHALNGVIRGGANNPRAEDDMAPPITMNDPIADLHGHSRDIVQQLVGPFAVCR